MDIDEKDPTIDFYNVTVCRENPTFNTFSNQNNMNIDGNQLNNSHSVDEDRRNSKDEELTNIISAIWRGIQSPSFLSRSTSLLIANDRCFAQRYGLDRRYSKEIDIDRERENIIQRDIVHDIDLLMMMMMIFQKKKN